MKRPQDKGVVYCGYAETVWLFRNRVYLGQIREVDGEKLVGRNNVVYQPYRWIEIFELIDVFDLAAVFHGIRHADGQRLQVMLIHHVGLDHRRFQMRHQAAPLLIQVLTGDGKFQLAPIADKKRETKDGFHGGDGFADSRLGRIKKRSGGGEVFEFSGLNKDLDLVQRQVQQITHDGASFFNRGCAYFTTRSNKMQGAAMSDHSGKEYQDSVKMFYKSIEIWYYQNEQKMNKFGALVQNHRKAR